MTRDLRIVSLSPTLGAEVTIKIKLLKKNYFSRFTDIICIVSVKWAELRFKPLYLFYTVCSLLVAPLLFLITQQCELLWTLEVRLCNGAIKGKHKVCITAMSWGN